MRIAIDMGNFVILTFLINFVWVASAHELVSDKCLHCLCLANTNCNWNIGCTDQGVCGGQAIGGPYFQDCNVPGRSYKGCANNRKCADTCVRNYMARYKKDCDGNGIINCWDFARIHRLGPFGCDGKLPPAYNQVLKKCLKK
uniref:lysozyme n=1 Tax=Graphocephala atropunctata TaxID=36148 RepID=A0A1B6MU71_9HEMI